VLLIFSILAAVTTEFVYIVYSETVSLYSWRDLQRLSLEAESGIKVGESFLKEVVSQYDYTYPDRVDFPVPDVSGDGGDAMLISVIDENAKLNLNKIVEPNGTIDERSYSVYNSVKRLFNTLEIDEVVLDAIIDWIDEDIEERVSGSESFAKNGYLYSIDELTHIRGVTDEIYKKLLPHVTIFGDGLININSADKYVLMSLSDQIGVELAGRVVTYRQLRPFKDRTDLRNVAGFDSLYKPLGGRITARGIAFTVEVSAYKGDLKKSVSAVLAFKNRSKGSELIYKYWKES
jgi:general secretion pathway protein K